MIMRPGLFEHTVVSPSQKGSISTIYLIGQVASAEKIMKGCGRTDGRSNITPLLE